MLSPEGAQSWLTAGGHSGEEEMPSLGLQDSGSERTQNTTMVASQMRAQGLQVTDGPLAQGQP